MNNRELMLAAIGNLLDDDVTTAAALDAIREESGCTLLAAVLEVASVWKSARDNLDVQEARTSLAPNSTIHSPLTEAILANALNVPEGAFTHINIVPGDAPPVATDNSRDNIGLYPIVAAVSVGALWVKRIANAIMMDQRQAARKARSRRGGQHHNPTGR